MCVLSYEILHFGSNPTTVFYMSEWSQLFGRELVSSRAIFKDKDILFGVPPLELVAKSFVKKSLQGRWKVNVKLKS